MDLHWLFVLKKPLTLKFELILPHNEALELMVINNL